MLDGYDVAIETGQHTIDDIAFSNNPVVQLNSVSVLDNNKVTLTQIDYGHNRLRLKFNNNSSAVVRTQLNASATYLDSVKRIRTIDGTKLSRTALVISNPLIQTPEHADIILNGMKEAIADPFSLFDINSRGNCAMEIGDVLEIKAPIAKIISEHVEIRRANYTYDGGLEATYVARRVKYD
ncbi:hypothetical protein D3C79_669050 [compost metagenome]